MLPCFLSLGKHEHMNFHVCRTIGERLFFFLFRALDGLWRENRGSVTRLKWKLQCTLSSTIPASKQLSITLYRQCSRYCTWSTVFESPFPDSNCLKILNNTLWRWFLAATWQSTLSAYLTAEGRKWQRGWELHPFPLCGCLIFVHWVSRRIWQKHNTTSIHMMKQITIWERKAEYKNSESNPILDDNIEKCIIECRIAE